MRNKTNIENKINSNIEVNVNTGINHNITGETIINHDVIADNTIIDNSKVNIINASLCDTITKGHKLYANRPECHIIANDNVNIIEKTDINNTINHNINIIDNKINHIITDAIDIDTNNEIIDHADTKNIKNGINTKTITNGTI